MLQIRLKELRERKGISQARLADELGIRQSTVGMWESGKNKPHPDMLVKLSKYFGVSVDYLLGRNVSSSPAGVVMGYGGDEQKVIRYETEEERTALATILENADF